jgi:hypothetical protein
MSTDFLEGFLPQDALDLGDGLKVTFYERLSEQPVAAE